MKKALYLLTALCMVLCLAGCRSNALIRDNGNVDNDTDGTVDRQTADDILNALSDRVDALIDRKLDEKLNERDRLQPPDGATEDGAMLPDGQIVENGEDDTGNTNNTNTTNSTNSSSGTDGTNNANGTDSNVTGSRTDTTVAGGTAASENTARSSGLRSAISRSLRGNN